MIISFCGFTFGCWGTICLYKFPRTKPVEFGQMSKGSTLLAICCIILTAFWTGSIDTVLKTGGSCKGAMGLISYVPQIIHICKMKSTYGFALEGVLTDFAGALLAIFQIVLDHYRIDDGKGFWEELNWAKFLCTTIVMMCTMMFLFQHFVLFGSKKTDQSNDEPMITKDAEDCKENLVSLKDDDLDAELCTTSAHR